MSEIETEPDFEPAPRTSEAMLQAQLVEARALLRLVEEKMMGDSGYCYACECHGHAKDCRLAKALGQ